MKTTFLFLILFLGSDPARAVIAPRFSQEYRKLPDGRKLRAGRLSLKGPSWGLLPALQAEAVLVPKGGDPRNHRLATELNASAALIGGFLVRLGWSEEHDSSLKPSPRKSETRWSAVVSLKF